MDYHLLYTRIIEHRRRNPVSGELYCEAHHIIPKSLDGDNSKENLVDLTAREHFICHWLLAKMYVPETCEWYKMNHAFLMMKCVKSLN